MTRTHMHTHWRTQAHRHYSPHRTWHSRDGKVLKRCLAAQTSLHRCTGDVAVGRNGGLNSQRHMHIAAVVQILTESGAKRRSCHGYSRAMHVSNTNAHIDGRDVKTGKGVARHS